MYLYVEGNRPDCPNKDNQMAAMTAMNVSR
jgi:hypothetical protein